MSKRKLCPICRAVHNDALRGVIVRLEQAPSRAPRWKSGISCGTNSSSSIT